jgi:hypothetical protein
MSEVTKLLSVATNFPCELLSVIHVQTYALSLLNIYIQVHTEGRD